MRLLLPLLFLGFNLSAQAPGGGMTDPAGNQYETVIIGDQEWMSENLNTDKLRNGTTILEVSYWNYYDFSAGIGSIYGKLYKGSIAENEYSVCPNGWRVPSSADWNQLITYLGGAMVAGKKMKHTGYFLAPNPADNSSGLSLIPGGFENATVNGSTDFYYRQIYGYYWSSTPFGSSSNYYIRVENNQEQVFVDDNIRSCKMSVRCMRNAPVGVIELKPIEKELVKLVDLMGRETEFKPNTTLIYIYSDGSTEKKFVVE